mmetsp:Transcript_32061/g.48420  ORF Transcript_32061/g.48420 Transcript_32061/m.48420 type:complete len:284 (-) Transcript_32061:55-906(-)
MAKEAVFAASVPSGFSRRQGQIVIGFVLLSAIYGAAYFLVKHFVKLPSDPKYCSNQKDTAEPCYRPDLFAFQLSSGIMQIILATTGFRSWSKQRTAVKTPEGRLFGFSEEAEYLNAVIILFQSWDFVFSLTIPEHATPVFLGHHLLAALTAWFSLKYQLVYYYATFFGGCSEISSVFLVLCDFDVYFPADRGSIWGGIIFFCQVSFVFTFFYYRVIGWFWVSLPLWTDVINVLKNNSTTKLRAERVSWFLIVFLGMNVILGLLQVYWFGFGIVPKILEILEEE